MMPRFRLSSALVYALSFLPRAWGRGGIALLALSLVLVLPLALTRWGPGFDGAAPGIISAFGVLVLVFSLMLDGALLRLAVSGSGRPRTMGVFGLQFSALETRLFFAQMICLGFWGLVAAALLAVAFLLGRALGLDLAEIRHQGLFEVLSWNKAIDLFPKTSGSGQFDPQSLLLGVRRALDAADLRLWVFDLGALFLFFVWIRVGIGLQLALPATASQGRMVSLDALNFAHGRVGRLFWGLFLTLLPALIWGFAFLFLGHFDNPLSKDVFFALGVLIFVWISIPLRVAFFASAYRQGRLD